MPDDLLFILKVDAQNLKPLVRAKYDALYKDKTNVLLIIMGEGPKDIEQNARDAAAVNKSVRRAIWIKSTEILTNTEIARFTNGDQNNVVCSESLSRTVGSWRDAKTASFYSEVNLCFYEAEARG
jgi:hypothetical protein